MCVASCDSFLAAFGKIDEVVSAKERFMGFLFDELPLTLHTLSSLAVYFFSFEPSGYELLGQSHLLSLGD